jgi:hypothetical protein
VSRAAIVVPSGLRRRAGSCPRAVVGADVGRPPSNRHPELVDGTELLPQLVKNQEGNAFHLVGACDQQGILEAMLDPDYYKSLSMELQGLKNRVRSLVRHWQTDGEWKESVVRSFLRRHLPRSVEVGRGFVVSPQGPSTQIDVLLFDTNKPVLFRDGDLAVVTPDSVVGAIEVKTGVNTGEFKEAAVKLCNVSQLIRGQATNARFFGLFAFEDRTTNSQQVLDSIKSAVGGAGDRQIDGVCLGTDLFVRYWELTPQPPLRTYARWRAYNLPNEAQGYFLHNVIEAIAPQSVDANSALWYPAGGKEDRCVGEARWRDDHPEE